MQAHTPSYLQPGDEIRIISTARAVEKEFIDSAVTEIEKRGFKVSLGENLYKRDNQFAGTDAERLADLNESVRDKNVRAIFAARGGYGTARLLKGFDGKAFNNDPKWICGYSDITALHSHLLNVFHTQSIHSTMPLSYETNTKEALDSLFELLEGKQVDYEAPTHKLNREGNGEGAMIGGNLSMLYSLLGSTAQASTDGKVLFLEDLDEYLYHVDRMMLALDRAGILKNLSGLVVGGMTEMNDNKVPFGKTAEEIIADRVAPYSFPVAFNFPSGHIDDNRAWTHGKKIRLTVRNGQPSLL
ncbi:LD-carboxypeptidase [Cryomorphaceae bacterium 1068]|nr:LD-carboxypeptidase [Cryomorphaceae bacterium 1068]